MGPHPNEATNWEVEEEEDGKVFLRLSLSGDFVGDLNGDVISVELDFPHPLYGYSPESEVLPAHVGRANYRFLRTLWQTMSEGRSIENAISAFYSSLSGLVATGRVTRFQSQVVWMLLHQWGFLGEEDIHMTWSSRPSSSYVNEFYDSLVVVRQNIEERLFPAVSIIRESTVRQSRGRRRQRITKLEVTDQAVVWNAPGYATAVPINLLEESSLGVYLNDADSFDSFDDYDNYDDYEEEEGDDCNKCMVTIVNSNSPERGYWKAIPLDIMCREEDKTEVTFRDVNAGYYPAQRI